MLQDRFQQGTLKVALLGPLQRFDHSVVEPFGVNDNSNEEVQKIFNSDEYNEESDNSIKDGEDCDDYLNQEKSSEDLKENDNENDVEKSRSDFSALDERELDDYLNQEKTQVKILKKMIMEKMLTNLEVNFLLWMEGILIWES